MSLPLATAGALAALACIFSIRYAAWRKAAGWFSLAAIGQGAALSLITAGPATRYHHYEPLAEIIRNQPWALAILALQAVIVSVAWVVRLRGHAMPSTRWRAVGLAVLLSVATAATVSPDVRRYLSELALAALIQLLGIATIALIAADAPEPAERRARPRVNPEDDLPVDHLHIEPRAISAAIGATVVAAALNVFAYDRLPHVPDEVAYLHHAKYLAAGQLSMPAPPVPAAFDVDLMEYEPSRWYSPVPPGWPVVLAAGAWAGVPWLVNPILSGINVLLAYLLVAQLYSRRTARRTSQLLAISPWFLFLGMSYMPHQLMLFFALVASFGVAAARRTESWHWGLVAGAGIGGVSLIRPLDGVVVGGLIGVWALGFGGRRLRLSSLAALGLGTVLVGATVFPYNRMLTGDALTFPINAYVNKHYAPNANSYGFGPDRGMGWPTDPNPGHTPVDGLINANLNTFAINTDLFGWVTGSLIFVTWMVCSRAWRRQDYLMFAALLAFPLAYFPYYFSGGPDFGARYWFPAIIPLVVLSIRGMQSIAELANMKVWVAVAALCLMTLGTYVPWRAADKYHHYRGMRADVRELAAERGFGADLVLVRGKRFPDYASAFAENPIDLQSEATIYAWDRDLETRAAVLREYADRRVWIIDGPSVTGEGFEVTAGPVAASDLLKDLK